MTTNHPRLWFNAEELKQLRESAKTGLRAKALKRLKEVCEALLTPGNPNHLDYQNRHQEDWKLRHGTFRILPSITALALGYAFTEERRYGDAARDALMVIIDNGLADQKSSAWGAVSEGWRHGPGHDKGKFALMVAAVYDLCHDRLTDAQRSRIAEYAKESIALAAEYTRFDIDQIANNRGIRGLAVRAWLNAALAGDFDLSEDPKKVLTGYVYQLDMHLFLSIDNQGAPYEGPGYVASIGGLLLLAEAMKRHGFADLTHHSRFERLPDYFVYELVPGGGSTNNHNDADMPCGSILASLPFLGAERGEILPWLAQQLDLHPARRDEWLEDPDFIISDHHASGLLMMLKWWKDDLPVKSPAELGYPTSHCFPTHGIASLRTGWNAGDWLVSHTCGRKERRCHRQGDYNHITFYAEGEQFLADAGYGKHTRGDPTQNISRWYAATDAHNCVMIDGILQRDVFNNPGWAEGAILDFQETDAFVTSLGDASDCTGVNNHVNKSLRRVVLVKQSPVKYAAVIDLVENDGNPFEATINWQTAIGQSISIEGDGFVIHGKSRNCAAHVLYPANVKFTPNEHFSHPQVRAAITGNVVEIVTIFCPVQSGASQPTFKARRLSEGTFEITCAHQGKQSTLRASAAVHHPMRRPEPVEFKC